MIKVFVRAVINWIKLVIGLIFYWLSNTTLPFSYQALISTFCFTNGKSNDIISKLISFKNKKYKFDYESYFFKNFNDNKQRIVLRNLQENGYHIFEDKLPIEICESLLKFAKTEECTIRKVDQNDVDNKTLVTKYDSKFPKAVRYDFSAEKLIKNEKIQLIMAETVFQSIAQEYFGSKPFIDIIGMWWTTSFSKTPDKNAAQYYHFDMDRIKWLKFFIYLTDVNAANGPHSYISGTHKSKSIPNCIMKKGYSRISDEKIKSFYKKERFIEFIADQGTIIVEDTRGLHKGKHVEKGERLILQFQYSNSLFGGSYPKFMLREPLNAKLRDKIKKYPDLYTAYL